MSVLTPTIELGVVLIYKLRVITDKSVKTKDFEIEIN